MHHFAFPLCAIPFVDYLIPNPARASESAYVNAPPSTKPKNSIDMGTAPDTYVGDTYLALRGQSPHRADPLATSSQIPLTAVDNPDYFNEPPSAPGQSPAKPFGPDVAVVNKLHYLDADDLEMARKSQLANSDQFNTTNSPQYINVKENLASTTHDPAETPI